MKRDQVFGLVAIFAMVGGVWLLVRGVASYDDFDLAPSPRSSRPASANLAELHGGIDLSRSVVTIYNLDEFHWMKLRVDITSGSGETYTYYAEMMPFDKTVRLKLADFVRPGGARFDQDRNSIAVITVSADMPDGARGVLRKRF